MAEDERHIIIVVYEGEGRPRRSPYKEEISKIIDAFTEGLPAGPIYCFWVKENPDGTVSVSHQGELLGVVGPYPVDLEAAAREAAEGQGSQPLSTNGEKTVLITTRIPRPGNPAIL